MSIRKMEGVILGQGHLSVFQGVELSLRQAQLSYDTIKN